MSKSIERNTKAVFFSNMVNPLLLFVCTSKAHVFPLQSDYIFTSDSRSPVLARKSSVCVKSGPSHACSFSAPPFALCKDFCKCSVRCNSLSLCSNNVDRVNKPEYPIVSSADGVTSISKSLKFTPTIGSSTYLFRVVSHCNIHRKRKLHKNVIALSFINSANCHDIAKKFIVGKNGISVF